MVPSARGSVLGRPAALAARFATSALPRMVRELQAFVRIPSVSADPARAADVARCAQWLAGRLSGVGLRRVHVHRTPRHPIVYGEWTGAVGRPTVLVYGHYDVQPADGRWTWPPFSGQVHGGFLHGRGASDDKGQLFAHVKAIEALLAASGRLPVNVKCVFEGEEEIGSTHLPQFLRGHLRALSADIAVMSDTRMLGPDAPALTYALRGQLALEIEVRGPSHDLHSGNFGGAVHDPLQALCEIVAKLHDDRGRIAVPGFYDRVRRGPRDERRYLAATGPSDDTILRETGAPTDWGEREYSMYERLTLRPSLAVTGLSGGHAGQGPKAVIPAVALAKISLRLVPDQDPEDIERRVRAFIRRVSPPTVKVVVRTHIRTRPAVIDPRHPAMQAASRAYAAVFGRRPGLLRSGGSIPVVSELQRLMGLPTVLMGFASPGDGLHGPNERFSLENFRRGILTSIRFLEEVAQMPTAGVAGRRGGADT